MKIIFLTTDITQVGGVERVLCKLCNFMVKEYNYNIKIVSLYKPKRDKVYFSLDNRISIKYLNVESNTSSMSCIKRILNQISMIRAVKTGLKNEEFDIVVTTNTMLGVAAALNKKHINGKIIASEHGDYYYFGKVWRYARKKLYNRLDKVIVLTEKDKIMYEDFLNNTEVIPNSLPFETDKKSNLDSKKILSVGRLEEEKGFEYIIESFSKISERYPQWKLEIVGEGSQKEKLLNRVKELKLEERIYLSNFTDNIIEKYLDSSIYTLTSRTEAFPLVILEAMECGVPCISFDLAGPKEMINNNIDGIIVKQYDIDELANQLENMIIDEEKRKLFGKNAKENIQKYSIANIGVKWKILFEDILMQ